jgi:hypothetical protein
MKLGTGTEVSYSRCDFMSGRHHMPGPNRFRSEGVRGNNDGM